MDLKFKDFANHTLNLALGIGLITGLVEGILLFAFHRFDLLTWRLQNRAIWYETLWIAPLTDVILFELAGALFALVGYPLQKYPVNKAILFALVFLSIFDGLFIILFGRLSLEAILLLAAGLSVQTVNHLSRRAGTFFYSIRSALPRLVGAVIAFILVIQGGGWIRERMLTANLPAAQADSPNVIVIVVDTLRADHLSSYGYGRDTAPFMDSLAAQGVRFENAISPSSWTQPSHASMLTGRYTYEHHAETQPLDDRYPTIGEVMQANGYRTGAFSANTLFFTRRQGFGRGFLHFEDNYLSVQDAFLNSTVYGFLFDFYGLRKALNYEGVPARRTASDINDSMLDWIDAARENPFFIFVNYFDVHDPYTPPEPYRSKYASAPNPGGLVNGFVERYHPDLTPEQLQSEIDAYDGSILYVDEQIKSLFAELESRGELENTIVIITSDHGESLGEHGLLQHSASLYRQEIHVPLIVWGAGVPVDGRIDMPVSTTSIPSTILSLVNIADDPFPTPSLTQLIFANTPPTDSPQPISEVAQFAGAAEENPTTHGEMKSAVSADFQYIAHETFGEELYDWRADPDEINNLLPDPKFQPSADLLSRYLRQLIGELFRIP